MSDLGGPGLTCTTITDRLTAIRGFLGERDYKSMSLRLGLSPDAWRRAEKGDTKPSADTLLRLAELGFSPTWVLTGQGPMRLDEAAPAAAMPSHSPTDLSERLFGRIIDAITRIYKEERIGLPAMDLGALAIQKYKEIAASAEPDAIQDEMVQISMVRLMASQLRRELQTTASAQGNSKREASG